MAKFTTPRARGPLLVISVVVVVFLIFRVLVNFSFGGSSAIGRTRSKEISMLTFNIWLSTEKMRERMEALGQIVEDLQPDLLTFSGSYSREPGNFARAALVFTISLDST